MSEIDFKKALLPQVSLDEVDVLRMCRELGLSSQSVEMAFLSIRNGMEHFSNEFCCKLLLQLAEGQDVRVWGTKLSQWLGIYLLAALYRREPTAGDGGFPSSNNAPTENCPDPVSV